MWKIISGVITILDPGAQFARRLQVCYRILVVAARRIVAHDPPAIADQVEHETVEARCQFRGDGFIHDHERYAAIFLGRQIQSGGPVPGFSLFLAGTEKSILVSDTRLNFVILVDPGEASNRGKVLPRLLARLAQNSPLDSDTADLCSGCPGPAKLNLVATIGNLPFERQRPLRYGRGRRLVARQKQCK